MNDTSRRLHRLAAAALALALAPPAARGGDGPGAGPIQDNSFLVEEAYNQEPGVVQHIGTFLRNQTTGEWVSSFTEEWPVGGQTHQASVTLVYSGLEEGHGPGDAALNYRWQAIGSGEAPVAFAPRASLLVPTGDARRRLGAGGPGLQLNFPLSVVLSSAFVTHLNVGGTVYPSAYVAAGEDAWQTSFSAGDGLVWLAHPNFNVMLEVAYSRNDLMARAGTQTDQQLWVSPGLRGAINLGALQIVPGIAVPIGAGPTSGEYGLFFYLSLEHPLALAGKTAEELEAEKAKDGARR